MWDRFRKATLAALALIVAVLCPIMPAASEPGWWTQYKQNCRAQGGTISDYYNDAMAQGGCRLPVAPQPVIPQKSPEEIAAEAARARQIALQQKANEADQQGGYAAARGDWSGAVAAYSDALRYDPANAIIGDHLAYARKRLEDSQLAPRIDQFRQQNRDASQAARIDAERNRLHSTAWSPSTDLEPWTREAFERQYTILEARRMRAEEELAKVNAWAAPAHEAEHENERVIDELTEDSVSDVLDVLQGILAVSGEQVPPEAKQEIDILLNAAQMTAHGNWAIRADPGSQRKSAEALSTLVALTGMLTAVPPAGVKPQTWEALRYAVGDMNKLMRAANGSVSFPTDGTRLKRLLTCMDQLVEIAGSLPVVGPPIAGARGAGQLLWFNLPRARSRLMSDREELETASVNIQSARRYWITRIGDLAAQEAPYEASLGIKHQ